MVSLTVILVTGAIAAILYFWLKEKNGKKLPPGPKPLPLIGNILSIGKKPQLTFGSWVPEYGNIFTVKMMNIRMVIISDQKLAREAYNQLSFLGAPDLEAFKVFSQGDYGILATSGSKWTEIRRFTLRHLRDYGFGKNTMEGRIMNEVTEFTDILKASEGKPVGVKRLLQLAVVNSLWSIMGGQRFNLDDKKLNDMLDAVNKAFNETTASPIGVFFPALAKAFPSLSGWNRLVDTAGQFSSFIKDFVTEHRKQYNVTDTPNDFTESYIQEIHNTTDPSSTFFGPDGDKNLIATLGGLFGAGSGTTSDTLSFCLLYLCTWPEYQTKVQEEIDRVVGKSRDVALEDRKDMPLVQAVISETLRFSSLTPLGLFHETLEDTVLDSYVIPKGTWLAVNQHYIHFNKNNWGPDVDTFNPMRFLSKDGKTVLRSDHLIPFSVGRRACAGESLARDEIFLFLSNILQKFVLKFDPSKPKPNVESATNLFHSPHAYDVIVKDRIISQ